MRQGVTLATGKGGGFWGKQPPGNKLLGLEKKAEKRQAAGKNPSVTPGQIASSVAELLSPPKNPTLVGGKPVVGGPVFAPLGALGVDALTQLPAQVKQTRETAVKIAHPDQYPPSLGQNIEGLLSGAFGFPRMGVNEPHPRMNPVVPKVPRGKSTPETAGELGQQVREGLRGASAARKQQDVLYSAERGKRADAAEQAMADLGGTAGYRKALNELKGELSKLRFGGLEDFDQAGMDALFTHIQQHPTLRPFEKIRTQTALKNVVDGRVPTRSELDLMGRVFGKEVSGTIAASVPFFQKAKRLGLELINVPRSLMASFDLSAPFRQGLVAGARHPVLFSKNFGPMVKSFGSERFYQSMMDEIASRPTFPKMQDAGVALTDMGRLDTREEQFMSNLAERIPIVGRGVRMSGRAYTGFLNRMRADMFDFYLDSAEKQGIELGPDGTKSVARFINSATGRGDLGMLSGHAVTLNSLFFSPRLLFSRLNFLNPAYYAKLDPFARKQALRAALQLTGTVGATLFLAKMAGADVNEDPRNADFAKIKVGNTRIDVLGGFQQPVRLLAQLSSGKVISSTTGKTLSLGPQGPGNLSRRDIAQRFFEAKLAPVPSLVNDAAKGTDFTGQPFSWKAAAVQRMTPLLAQDIRELHKEKGSVPLDVGAYALGALGIGIQTYGPKPAKQSGGPSFWGDSSGSSGSSFWGKP